MDAEAWNARYASSDLVWGADPNRFVAAELADLAPGRALDLACGEGRNAIWLASRGWTVTAVDFAGAAIDKGRRLAAHEGVQVEWRVDDVTAFKPDAGFDLLLWSYLQLAGSDRERALQHAIGAVAPGGTFLFIAHDLRNLAEGVGGPSEASVLYRAADIASLLAGFTIVHAGEVLRPVMRDDGTTADAIDCLVRAVRYP
ncbi:MAG: SAM-dependent methyltransferase [Actinomycetia bacterium]|nr:SAM-dependent methyltransferase [Actinomycetes bacterium]